MTDREPVVWCEDYGTHAAILGKLLHLSVYAHQCDGVWGWKVSRYPEQLEAIAIGREPTLEAAQAAALECARRIARELAEACGWEVRPPGPHIIIHEYE